MEPELIFRTIAIIIAAGLLLSNFDHKPALSWIANIFKRNAPVVPSINNKKDVDFLDVVESWHTLKNQCKVLELNEATHKLDEVFPLLNTEE